MELSLRATILAAALAATFPSPAKAAAPCALAEAQAQLARGDHPAAEASFDVCLAGAPGSAEARLGRATARAYQGRHGAARADYDAVLAADPKHLGALTGLGWSLAWSGDHPAAERTFERALAVAPGHPDARKGLDWTRQDRARHARLRADATVLGGLTALPGDERLGVRFAEVAVSPGEHLRVWVQYDDSLSLDSAGLARDGRRAPAGYAGGLYEWGGRFLTRLEGGYRSLPGGVGQGLARGEQVVLVGRGAVKAGGWFGPRDDGRREGGAHAGLELPIGARLKLEPLVTFGRGAGAGDTEVRGLLGAKLGFRGGAEVGAGAAVGRAARGALPDATVAAGWLRGSAPLGERLRAHVLVTRDSPSVGGDVTAFSVGLTLGLGGRP